MSSAWISSKSSNEMALNELMKAGSCEEGFYFNSRSKSGQEREKHSEE